MDSFLDKIQGLIFSFLSKQSAFKVKQKTEPAVLIFSHSHQCDLHCRLNIFNLAMKHHAVSNRPQNILQRRNPEGYTQAFLGWGGNGNDAHIQEIGHITFHISN